MKNKIAPVIAAIFSPLVLLTTIIYLVSIPFAGKDPYNDRDFLFLFNLMLIGVMGIIVFTVSETSIGRRQRFSEGVLFALVLVTLVIDAITLSAILYRLGQYGITPNRAAVLGSNLLLFVNLILIIIDLYRVNFRAGDLRKVEGSIAGFLPVYALWTVLVVFGWPLLFGMR